MRASIVVPTRDRQQSLARLLAALSAQNSTVEWELIVVDDASSPPVDVPAPFSVLRGNGEGPAKARNTGWRQARGDIVIFTDDDTEPAPGWLEAAVRWLDSHPADVGVEGRVVSPPWDPLRAMSVTSDGPGGYLTANIAFRRSVLEELGGFSTDFPFPHGEDYDLAYRALELGGIGYEPAMEVLHHPRPMSFREFIRRGRYAGSEVLLFRRHRKHFGRLRRLPAPLYPLVNTITAWIGLARVDRRRWLRSPGRMALWAALMTGSLLNAVAALAGPRPGRRT